MFGLFCKSIETEGIKLAQLKPGPQGLKHSNADKCRLDQAKHSPHSPPRHSASNGNEWLAMATNGLKWPEMAQNAVNMVFCVYMVLWLMVKKKRLSASYIVFYRHRNK